jgi:hypothetical protein
MIFRNHLSSFIVFILQPQTHQRQVKHQIRHSKTMDGALRSSLSKLDRYVSINR